MQVRFLIGRAIFVQDCGAAASGCNIITQFSGIQKKKQQFYFKRFCTDAASGIVTDKTEEQKSLWKEERPISNQENVCEGGRKTHPAAAPAVSYTFLFYSVYFDSLARLSLASLSAESRLFFFLFLLSSLCVVSYSLSTREMCAAAGRANLVESRSCPAYTFGGSPITANEFR